MSRDDLHASESDSRWLKAAAAHVPWRRAELFRLIWTAASAFVVESFVFGVAVVPAVLFLEWHVAKDIEPHVLRVVFIAMALIPAYLIFAVSLMILSALAMRVLGWRTPADATLRIDALEWPLCNWARYGISIHLVRIFAGTLLRTTPLWCWYMRMNGAKLGRRVFVNSLDVTDHCLLEFGDDVVIGAGVHLSGHTVERGELRTAAVRLGNGVTVGVSANVEIGVEAGPGCQIGALSAVPKFARLAGHTVYVGIPARPLARSSEIAHDA